MGEVTPDRQVQHQPRAVAGNSGDRRRNHRRCVDDDEITGVEKRRERGERRVREARVGALGELVTRRGVLRVEVKIAVIDGRCRSACFCVRDQVPHIHSHAHRVAARGISHIVDVLKDP